MGSELLLEATAIGMLKASFIYIAILCHIACFCNAEVWWYHLGISKWQPKDSDTNSQPKTKYYTLGDKKTTWQEANDYCRARNAMLWCPRDESEHNMVYYNLHDATNFDNQGQTWYGIRREETQKTLSVYRQPGYFVETSQGPMPAFMNNTFDPATGQWTGVRQHPEDGSVLVETAQIPIQYPEHATSEWKCWSCWGGKDDSLWLRDSDDEALTQVASQTSIFYVGMVSPVNAAVIPPTCPAASTGAFQFKLMERSDASWFHWGDKEPRDVYEKNDEGYLNTDPYTCITTLPYQETWSDTSCGERKSTPICMTVNLEPGAETRELDPGVITKWRTKIVTLREKWLLEQQRTDVLQLIINCIIYSGFCFGCYCCGCCFGFGKYIPRCLKCKKQVEDDDDDVEGGWRGFFGIQKKTERASVLATQGPKTQGTTNLVQDSKNRSSRSASVSLGPAHQLLGEVETPKKHKKKHKKHKKSHK